MPKVNRIAACRKSPGKCSKCGDVIEKGQPYCFWAFMQGGRGGTKIIRCGKPACQPKGSDLTRSEYLGAILRLQESTEFDAVNADDLEAQKQEVVDELENLKSDTEDKYNNLPEGLQNGKPGELLQGRIDALETGVQELDGIDISEFDEEEPEKEKDKGEWVEKRDAHYQNIQQRLKDALESISAD